MSHIMAARLALAKHGFHFTHSLGQNFLLDEFYIARIADAADVNPGDNVLEIGAGAGVLTAEMLDRGAKVLALELDEALRPVLGDVLEGRENISLVFADAMKADIGALAADYFGAGAHFRVVANLPYYITTDVILRLIEWGLPMDSIIVLVQQEAAERIMAKTGKKTWCALAATVQYFGAPEILMDVPPQAFTPRPHVNSCLLKIGLYGDEKPDAAIFDRTYLRLVNCAFAMRRKTLANNLTASYKMPRETAISLISDCELSKTIRGEALSIKQLVVLADKLHNIQEFE